VRKLASTTDVGAVALTAPVYATVWLDRHSKDPPSYTTNQTNQTTTAFHVAASLHLSAKTLSTQRLHVGLD